MVPVVVAVSGKAVLVPFELSLVVVIWVAPLVAGNVDSNLSHTVVLGSAVPVSVHPLDLVWGSFFYLMCPGCFARSWRTSYRLSSRVNRLDKKCTKLVGYTPSCCGLLHCISNIFIRLCSLVVLVGIGKILVAPTKNRSHPLLVGYLVLSLYLTP